MWKALDHKGRTICTVTISQLPAETDQDFLIRARHEVTRQLNRPGRRPFFRSWIAGGKRICNDEDL